MVWCLPDHSQLTGRCHSLIIYLFVKAKLRLLRLGLRLVPVPYSGPYPCCPCPFGVNVKTLSSMGKWWIVDSRLSCQTMHDYIIITVTWPDLYWTSRRTVHHYIPASAISADFIWLHLISSYMILFVAAVSFKLIYDTIQTWSEEIISPFPKWSPALCGEDGG